MSIPQPLLSNSGSLFFTASLEIDQVEIELYVRYEGKISGLLRSPAGSAVVSVMHGAITNRVRGRIA
jgi:hypothetical protein